VLHLQDIVAGALNVLRDFVSMGGAELQGSQYQHVERALQKFCAFVWRHDGRQTTIGRVENLPSMDESAILRDEAQSTPSEPRFYIAVK
jgi:hypothetical protein